MDIKFIKLPLKLSKVANSNSLHYYIKDAEGKKLVATFDLAKTKDGSEKLVCAINYLQYENFKYKEAINKLIEINMKKTNIFYRTICSIKSHKWLYIGKGIYQCKRCKELSLWRCRN